MYLRRAVFLHNMSNDPDLLAVVACGKDQAWTATGFQVFRKNFVRCYTHHARRRAPWPPQR